MDVLVGYATVHGSTRETAGRVAAGLAEAGLRVEARDLRTVDDADAYAAFVLGSAVHGQTWLEPAKDFVRDNLDLLGARPLWIFSVGMPAALRGPWRRLAPREASVIVESLPGELVPREHALFSGVIAPAHLPLTGQIMFRLVGGRFGDYRDWDAVDGWTARIAEVLTR
jgi:menaquinone-dependent protoporphyrinogen oxidase